MEKLKCKIGKGTIEVIGVKVLNLIELDSIRSTDNKVAFINKKGELTITSMQLFRRWTKNIVVAKQFIDRGVWDIVLHSTQVEEPETQTEQTKSELPQYEIPDLSQITVSENGEISEKQQRPQYYPESEEEERIGKLSNLDLRHVTMNVLFIFLFIFLFLYQINHYETLQYWQFIVVGVSVLFGNIYFIKQKKKLRK